MHPPLGRRLLPVAGLVTAALLVSTLTAIAPAYADDQPGAPAETPTETPTDAPAATPADPAASAAVDALQTVQELLDPAPAAAPVDPATAPDLTIALRDLRLRSGDLPRSYRAEARAILAQRPDQGFTNPQTDGNVPGVLIHYDAGTVTPAYLTDVETVIGHVLALYRAAGYRSPESDGVQGGDSRLDIYLQNLGNQGLYGYCDTDAPPTHAPYDRPAYCAFDNDFTEFPARTPLQNLEVTAAHELFHAVQFAYDYTEDGWFMEATATWAEDEVYTAINDNRQYLRESPLRQPGQSLDQLSRSNLRQYGEWIFFRYLTERYPAKQGALPKIMLNLWKRVDGSSGGPDDYSIRAVQRELTSRGTDLRRFYAAFADANRRPGQAYREGKAYPRAPAKGFTFGARSHDTRWRERRVDHLASTTLAFRPNGSLRHARLHVTVDLPNRSLGTAAVLTTYDAKNRPTRRFVPLSAHGNGKLTVGFGTTKVARADLTLSNAGIRYTCWVGPIDSVYYSCQGRSHDDNRAMRYRVWATR